MNAREPLDRTTPVPWPADKGPVTDHLLLWQLRHGHLLYSHGLRNLIFWTRDAAGTVHLQCARAGLALLAAGKIRAASVRPDNVAVFGLTEPELT